MNTQFYFGSISLSVDYIPSDDMIAYLSRFHPNKLYGVVEKGENGKDHFHYVGLTHASQNNIREGIKKILRKEEYEIHSKKSVVLLPEVKASWRLGYLQKEKPFLEIVRIGFTDENLLSAKAEYDARPKRKNQEDSDSKNPRLTKNKVVEYLIEHECYDTISIDQALTTLKTEGRFPYDLYEKLNCQKLYNYIRGNYMNGVQ